MPSLNLFIQKKIIVLHEDDSAQDAARAMRDHHASTVLVAGGDSNLAGIVTDRDFTIRLIANCDTTAEPLAKIMTAEPVTADEAGSVEEVLSLMEAHGVRRIPIRIQSSPEGHRWGLVTLDDLVAGGAVTIQRLGRIIKGKIRRQISGIWRARSEAHVQQTLRNFYRRVGDLADISSDMIPEISYFLLGALFRRITYSSATHFTAQLPKQLQEALFELPAGPDRDITVHAVLDEMIFRFRFTEAYAWSVVRKFYRALAEVLGPGVTEHLKAELPHDFQNLFEKTSEQPKEAEQAIERKVSRLQLKSRSFENAQVIPRDYTGDGADRSPSLLWSGVPDGTKEFVVLCEDPDAPAQQPWVHWIMYGISSNTTQIPEGIPSQPEIEYPVRLRQGKNSSGLIGYQGPLPPKSHGFHRYVFNLYALNSEVALPPGATKGELLEQISNHIIAEATLVGRYRREVAGRRNVEVA